MNKNIIIYTSSLCGFCYRAKSLLKKKNIPFEEIDIDLDYSKRNEMIKKSGGRTSVPQIFFKDYSNYLNPLTQKIRGKVKQTTGIEEEQIIEEGDQIVRIIKM